MDRQIKEERLNQLHRQNHSYLNSKREEMERRVEGKWGRDGGKEEMGGDRRSRRGSNNNNNRSLPAIASSNLGNSKITIIDKVYGARQWDRSVHPNP